MKVKISTSDMILNVARRNYQL
jgi:NADH dehydrogenase (ubiquinone) 1 alpha subcomplex subunit 9